MRLCRYICFIVMSILIGTVTIGTVSGATSIACVGNSITAGSKLPDTTKRFPSLLVKKLGTTYLATSIVNLSSPVTLNNQGVSGRTLLKKGTQPYWIEPAFSQVFTLKPAIITLMLGTNDTKPVNWVYSSEFEADYTAMVDTFLSISPRPKVILCLPPPVFTNTSTHSDSTMVQGIVPLLQKVAKVKGLPVIDARTPFLDKQSLFAADGLHPDTTGHKMLADIFYEGIVNIASEQRYKVMLLWYGNAPGIIGAESDTTAKPMLHVYPASTTTTRAAILVCPGGGYDHIAMEKEGDLVGEWLASKGITAFVLRYRYQPYRYPVPFNDAKRAMRLIRFSAEQYGIDTAGIGILGFSAGGHLASLVGTHYDNGNAAAPDPIETKKSRPDFMALMYSVITLTGSYTHTGSRDALLGTSPAPGTALLDSLSTQKWVNAQTPQTFLAHGDADGSVPIQNSMMFDSACAANSVPHKFMADPGMGHGYGMAGTWPDSLLAWLKARGITSATPTPTRQKTFFRAGSAVDKVTHRISKSGMLTISVSGAAAPRSVMVYSVTGRRVAGLTLSANNEYVWRHAVKGMYLVRSTGSGFDFVERINVTF